MRSTNYFYSAFRNKMITQGAHFKKGIMHHEYRRQNPDNAVISQIIPAFGHAGNGNTQAPRLAQENNIHILNNIGGKNNIGFFFKNKSGNRRISNQLIIPKAHQCLKKPECPQKIKQTFNKIHKKPFSSLTVAFLQHGNAFRPHGVSSQKRKKSVYKSIGIQRHSDNTDFGAGEFFLVIFKFILRNHQNNLASGGEKFI